MPNPAPSDLALPLWGQIAAALTFVAGAFGVVRNAWKSEPKPPEGHSDAVVISGAFADAQPIRELVSAVREATAASRESADATARFDRNQSERSRELRDAMDDVRKEARETNERLDSIREVIVRGVRIVPAAEPPA